MPQGMLGWLQATLLLLVAGLGTALVRVRDPRRQVLLAAVYGLALALVMMALQAPDVAMAELAVGVVATPLMLLATLASTSRGRAAPERAQDGGARDRGGPAAGG